MSRHLAPPFGLSVKVLAPMPGLPPEALSDAVDGLVDVSTDLALRLSRAFGTGPEFRLDLRLAPGLREAGQGTGTWRKAEAILGPEGLGPEEVSLV